MKILSVFEQPTRDANTYVVVAGGTGKDIACYYRPTADGWSPDQIAFSGEKLSEGGFQATYGAWDYQRDGFYYRS
jgi:hypothetical protein